MIISDFLRLIRFHYLFDQYNPHFSHPVDIGKTVYGSKKKIKSAIRGHSNGREMKEEEI